jgi:hypothetical protein
MSYAAIYFVMCVLALWLACMLAWSAATRSQRWMGIVVAVAIMVLAYPAINKVLSHPRLVSSEWWQKRDTQATLIAANVREGHGIDLWVMLPDSNRPRYYTMPWDDQSHDFVKKLMKAMEQAKKDGTKVQLKGLFDYDWSGEREKPITPSPDPIPLPPMKGEPDEPVLEFDA